MNKITAIVLIFITILLCLTFIVLWYHPITIRFEMDNNTLEAIKTINWSVVYHE